MKLLRYGERGAERPGVLDRDGRIRALGSHVSDIDAAALSPAGIERLKTLDLNALSTVPEGMRPPGVGLGQKPPRYLEVGDTVRLGIAGLGEQRQVVTAHSHVR